MNRSPFFYVGDKYKLMSQLLEKFPKKIETFIEPFVGGGSVFLNSKANRFLCNDLNPNIIALHIFLSSYKSNRLQFFQDFESTILRYGLSASYLGIFVNPDLKKKHPKTYYSIHNKQAYSNLKNDFNKEKSNYIKLYVLLIYGFNHMLRFNKSGLFNLPCGNVDYNKNVKKALNSYFDFIEKNSIEFKVGDFKSFLLEREYGNNDFVYLDPPYLITASEYNKDWDSNTERVLLDTIDSLNALGVKFALSNVFRHKKEENKLLIHWAKKYNILKIKSNYISYHDNSIKDSEEVLITNYLEEL